jgi:sterol desaturase/sphingolipid hydroxylase (fatty acid hydroxylase superfamily)
MSQLIPDDVGLFMRWIIAYGLLTARYVLFAGLAYLIFYIIKRKDWLFMKIQQKFPEKKQVYTEITYSFITFMVFASMVVAIRYVSTHHYLNLKIYRNLSDHSVLYYVLTTVFIIFFHDTYFYWAHRLMHHPLFYERVHKVHHLSKDPTPWAAFSFHPFEAILEIGFVPVLIFTIPLHFTSLLILSIWMILFNVMGHLGYETFPKSFIRIPVFRWLNTSTNHNMHHKYVKCNYGLYFNIWDYIMNTNHKKYYDTFDEVTTRREEGFRKLKESKEEEHGFEVDGRVATE